MSVPVIDLEELASESKRLIEACQEVGCFRITNHGNLLPPPLAAEMKAMVRSLLDLPQEIKRRNADVIPGSGYMGPTQTNPHYEALGLYDIASQNAVDEFCTLLNASPHHRETITSYADAIHKIAMNIANKIAQGLGLARVSFADWPCQFRINKYSFTPNTVGSSGVQVHTDSGFLTILQDDENVGGLEIIDKYGAFVAVDPLPGSLLVNLGDIATMWSNGRLYNVKHRVLCKEATTRISIATFLLGPRDDMVQSPAELVDSAHPRLFVPLSYEDYRKLRVSNKMDMGEALALLRTNS